MSNINDDRARFNRDRKAKIARRARKRKYLADLRAQVRSGASATGPSKVAS